MFLMWATSQIMGHSLPRCCNLELSLLGVLWNKQDKQNKCKPTFLHFINTWIWLNGQFCPIPNIKIFFSRKCMWSYLVHFKLALNIRNFVGNFSDYKFCVTSAILDPFTFYGMSHSCILIHSKQVFPLSHVYVHCLMNLCLKTVCAYLDELIL